MLRLDARRAAFASRQVVQRDDRRQSRLEPGASVKQALPKLVRLHEAAQQPAKKVWGGVADAGNSASARLVRTYQDLILFTSKPARRTVALAAALAGVP